MRIVATMVIMLFALGRAAWAQWSEEAQKCFEEVDARNNLDLAIDYCTRAIQSDELSKENLALTFAHRAIAYSVKGNYDRAIQDLDQAVPLYRSDISAVSIRGHIRFYQVQFAAAVPDLQRALRAEPRNLYRSLRLYLARSRSGIDARDDLVRATATEFDPEIWPGPIVVMYLGQIGSQAVLDAAADPNPRRQREKQCEAYFYIGQQLLIQGNKSQAVKMFQAAVATGMSNFIEYDGAKAELKRLGH